RQYGEFHLGDIAENGSRERPAIVVFEPFLFDLVVDGAEARETGRGAARKAAAGLNGLQGVGGGRRRGKQRGNGGDRESLHGFPPCREDYWARLRRMHWRLDETLRASRRQLPRGCDSPGGRRPARKDSPNYLRLAISSFLRMSPTALLARASSWI